MLNRLTYKQQFWLAMIGILAFGWIIWKQSISKTIALKDQNSEMRADLVESQNSDLKLALLQQELDQYDQIIGSGVHNPDVIQEHLLQTISTFKDARIADVQAIHKVNELDYELYTFSITVEAVYAELLSISATLENSFEDARLKAVDYHMKQESRTKKKRLYATFYLQHIRKA